MWRNEERGGVRVEYDCVFVVMGVAGNSGEGERLMVRQKALQATSFVFGERRGDKRRTCNSLVQFLEAMRAQGKPTTKTATPCGARARAPEIAEACALVVLVEADRAICGVGVLPCHGPPLVNCCGM